MKKTKEYLKGYKDGFKAGVKAVNEAHEEIKLLRDAINKLRNFPVRGY
jgi:hypothetical protein